MRSCPLENGRQDAEGCAEPHSVGWTRMCRVWGQGTIAAKNRIHVIPVPFGQLLNCRRDKQHDSIALTDADVSQPCGLRRSAINHVGHRARLHGSAQLR